MRNHDPIVDTEALISRKHAAASLGSHQRHHLLEPLIAPDAADNQHLRAADVGHRALGDLNEHGKDGLLKGEAEVLFAHGVAVGSA